MKPVALVADALTWTGAHLDRPLIQAVARGWTWCDQLISGKVRTRDEIPLVNGVSAPYVTRLLPLAWLAPDIIEAILEGRQPQGLTVERLIQQKLPLDWAEQRQVLGFDPRA